MDFNEFANVSSAHNFYDTAIALVVDEWNPCTTIPPSIDELNPHAIQLKINTDFLLSQPLQANHSIILELPDYKTTTTDNNFIA